VRFSQLCGKRKIEWKGVNTGMGTSTTDTRSTRHLEPARARDDGPARARTGWLKEFFARRLFNSATMSVTVKSITMSIPVGTAFGHWISKVIALPQLRRLAVGEVLWTPLRKSLSDSTVALIATGGGRCQLNRAPLYSPHMVWHTGSTQAAPRVRSARVSSNGISTGSCQAPLRLAQLIQTSSVSSRDHPPWRVAVLPVLPQRP
jgi:hypothetical protein